MKIAWLSFYVWGGKRWLRGTSLKIQLNEDCSVIIFNILIVWGWGVFFGGEDLDWGGICKSSEAWRRMASSS